MSLLTSSALMLLPEVALVPPVMPLPLVTVPPALPLVPPTALLALEPPVVVLELGAPAVAPLGYVLAVGLLAREPVLPVPLVLPLVLEPLPVVLAILPVPVPVVLADAEMLYFCSSSDTRELMFETWCLICSRSLDVATVELADGVVVDADGVDSVVLVLLVLLAAGAPGAGVVVTT